MSATLTNALVALRGPTCFADIKTSAAFTPPRGIYERYFPAGMSLDEVRRNAAHVCRELEEQRGDRLEPAAGCRIDRMRLGQAYVWVEWTRDAAEPANGISGEPVIEAVFINGMWVPDIADAFADRQIQEWADEAKRLLKDEAEQFKQEAA